MSYDVSLENDKGVVAVGSHKEGGTYAKGGTTDAEMSVTYNYSQHYLDELDRAAGLKWLDGKVAKFCVDRLGQAIHKLGDTPDHDYWKATPGNAGRALSILREWAKQHPDAVFRVS